MITFIAGMASGFVTFAALAALIIWRIILKGKGVQANVQKMVDSVDKLAEARRYLELCTSAENIGAAQRIAQRGLDRSK